MADNVTIPASGTGTATPVIATDDVSGVHYQYVKLVDGAADATGKIGGDATNGLDVDVTRLPSGTIAGASSLPAGTNNIGDVDVLSIAAGDNNIGNVDVVTLPNVTLAASTNTNEVVGDAAHDAAIAGNPVRVGGRAVNAELTAVANGDTADLVTDLVGKQIVMPYANPENFLSGVTSAITGTSDTSVIGAQGAGVRIYVTQILVTNSHATVGTVVNIKDNTTTIYTGYAAALGGGFSITFPVPLRLAANVALQAANATTGSNTYVSASGYKGA